MVLLGLDFTPASSGFSRNCSLSHLHSHLVLTDLPTHWASSLGPCSAGLAGPGWAAECRLPSRLCCLSLQPQMIDGAGNAPREGVSTCVARRSRWRALTWQQLNVQIFDWTHGKAVISNTELAVPQHSHTPSLSHTHTHYAFSHTHFFILSTTNTKSRSSDSYSVHFLQFGLGHIKTFLIPVCTWARHSCCNLRWTFVKLPFRGQLKCECFCCSTLKTLDSEFSWSPFKWKQFILRMWWRHW